MQTGILLTTESVRGQKVQQPRTSTTSATFGSVCYPQSEHLAALKEQIFLSIVQNYLQTTPPQSTEEHNMFKEYAKEMRFIITGVSVGSLVITVKCESPLILEGLWIDYLSGHLGEMVQNSFVTEKILKKLNLAMLRLETTMDIEEYNACKLAVDRSVVKNFSVFVFGRATFEDLSLKGYDIIANAIGSLGKKFELIFVGSSPGEHQKVEQWFLDNTCINRSHLTIRGYCNDPEELKMMYYQSDLVALPSRTEGFGLVALEAISAGIPILVSGESGIAEALREVEGGNTVIVELDEDADEWARRIREMSEESAEEREAKARRLRENYRKVYSWRAECERFKGMIEKVVENANAVDELDITIDVEDQKPAESNNLTTTSIMESEKYQMDELQKSSAAPEMQGSVSRPDTESLQALREKFFLLAGKNYLETTPPQSKEERDEFMDFMQELRVLIKCARQGSLVITVQCKSLQILEELWREYLSGHLGEVVQNCFVTETILKELNLAELKLKTTMDVEEYNACKLYFARVALRVTPPLAVTDATGKRKELEELTGKEGKWNLELEHCSSEERQESEVEDQKLNIKVDVEHVKLADQDTCSTASVSTMDTTECQKASIVSGARRKRRSDTDLEDVQPLEKKVLCLIAMNYLHTTPPESRDECTEFQEYLLDMKVHITCILPLSASFIFDPVEKLEELQRIQGSSPSVALSTAGRKKEVEGRHKPTKLQEGKGEAKV
ncbi:uncharacterized protein LOC111325582 [Stylophora pistillata]|uniref:uncharacterized protein LOC111325582 n=1 Tax=Stylophora pistillata TaxID=50429 RepID=UPI000C0531A1|nr:uncharacterized protein LOC111325582 [Stylophora pistillata]